MRTTTFKHLERIRNKFGPGIFGKIAQKLLALAMYDAGFCHVVERGVQGVDIDVAETGGKKYAMEVKTTDKNNIPLSKENIEALKDRANDGYSPMVAALRMQLFEDWLFANVPLSVLKPGTFHLSRLRAYRVQDLESLIRPVFEAVVNEHIGGVLSGGEHYLNQVLAQKREQALQ